jgi:hypothetical protein
VSPAYSAEVISQIEFICSNSGGSKPVLPGEPHSRCTYYIHGARPCKVPYFANIPASILYSIKKYLLIQGKLKKEFEYRLLEESGPEHDKTFVVEIDMEGECLGRGQGRTKKAAEQQAAYEALLLLRDRGYVFKKY